MRGRNKNVFYRFLLLIGALGLVWGISDTATGQGKRPTPIDIAYHSNSQAYFRLYKSTKPWGEAEKFATQSIYKGRQGRLAIIDTPEKHRWVVETFDFSKRDYANIIWIGLRYWCSFRKLMWVDGELLEPGDFSVWSAQWYRTNVRCGKVDIDYMGVYYTAKNRWQAAGQPKWGDHFLVEFPKR